MATLLLGNNEIANCDCALKIEGEEVFRVRERQSDGQLVVDFDLRDESGNRIAKIVKNHAVVIGIEYAVENRPGLYSVVHKTSGQPYATVREIAPDTVKVTGVFSVNGYQVIVTDKGIVTSDGNSVSDSYLEGWGTAVELRRGQYGIGCAES